MRCSLPCLLLVFVGCSTPSTPSKPGKLEALPIATNSVPTLAVSSASVAAVGKVECPPCSALAPTCSKGACVAPTGLGISYSIIALFADGTSRYLGEEKLEGEIAIEAKEITSTSYTTCALDFKGIVRCAEKHKPPFVEPPGLANATHLSMSGFRVCASLASGEIACISPDASSRKVSDVATVFAKTPSPVRQMVGSETHQCARLEDGLVMCWGSNERGECGTKKYVVDSGNSLQIQEPTFVEDLQGAVDVAVNKFGSCAALKDGTVACWGDMIGNKIVDITATRSMLTQPMTGADRRVLESTPRAFFFKGQFRKPERIEGIKDAITVAFGLRRLWVLQKDGSIVSVDITDIGEKKRKIEKLAGVAGAVKLAGTWEKACALTSANEIFCWQESDLGQFRPSPVVLRKIALDKRE